MQKAKNKIYNLLKWSEKYTETDMIYLAKGGAWLTSGQSIISLLSFLLAIAFANLLPAETYGLYKYVLSIASILAIANLSGMNHAVIRATAQGNEGIFLTALKTKIKWGFLASVGSVCLALYFLWNGDKTLFTAFLIISPLLSLGDSFNLYGALLQGKKLFDVYAKFNVISQMFIMGSLIITLFLTNNLFIILITYFLSLAIIRFAFLKITLQKIKPNQNNDTNTISYGKHLSLIGVMGIISGNIDKIILFHNLGSAQLAIYFFALAPVRQIVAVTNSIGQLAMPKFAQRNIGEIKKTIYKKVAKLSLIVVPITIVYIIISPFLFKIFFPQYIEAIIFSQAYALILLFQPSMFLGTIFTAHAKKKEMYIVNFLNPIVRIILYLILIPLYGIMGAVLSMLLGELIKYIILIFLLKKAND